MVFRRGNDYGGLAHSRRSQRVHAREDWYLTIDFGKEAAGSVSIGFGYSHQFTSLGIAGQFMHVKGVNCAHAAKARDRYFKSFGHRIFKNTMAETCAVISAPEPEACSSIRSQYAP